MSLSNTAVPKYYGEFRESVLRGETPVNQHISLEMNRIDRLIEDPNIYYDDCVVEGFIDYCEGELTLVDGSDVTMLPSFKLWGEQLFGWYYFEEYSVPEPTGTGSGYYYIRKRKKKRLVNKQFLILGRGGAKSMYDSFVQSYEQNIDTSTTQQITTAPTMKQAEEILFPIKTAIQRARGPLFQFMTEGSLQNTTGSKMKRQKLASTKKGIENFLTNSIIEIRPMSIDKLQGLRCKVATLDEWLSCDIREDPIDAIEQSASKIDDYIIICSSSEGTIRNGVGDTIKMELEKILHDEYINPHVSIWWYNLDSVDEVAHPDLWVKANPNLGKTVSYETYQRDVEKAEQVPSSRNDILAKRFGIPVEGHTYFFTYDETRPHKRKIFDKLPCSLGADLSQGDDFCSFSFLFPLKREEFGIRTRNYITSRTMERLPDARRRKYEEFLDEGSLVIMEGTVLDIPEVYEELSTYIDLHEYEVLCFGYDPYNATDFVSRWCTDNSEFGVDKVIQGFKTESVPLGELKKLAYDRRLIFDESIMQFAMGNCIVLEDTNGNRKLYKKRYEQKIDPVAATMDAYVAFKRNREAFE